MTRVNVVQELEDAASAALKSWVMRFRCIPTADGFVSGVPPEVDAFVVHPTTWHEYRREILFRSVHYMPQCGELLLLGKRVVTDYELSNFEVQIVVRP